MKRTFKYLLSLATLLVVLGFAGLAFADGNGPTVPQGATAQDVSNIKTVTMTSQAGWVALAAGLGLGLAALGGALGQGKAAAAALDGIARNPGAADKIRGPMILALALIESLVIYSLVIGFLLFGKIG